jgi:hypothetical protein
MHRSIGRRLAGATLVALLAGAAASSQAAAQARCQAPDAPGWRSCLTASHRTIDGGQAIHLTKVRPRLVIRYEAGCPKGADRRSVAVRTDDGARLGRTTVRSRCRRGVARYEATLELDVEVDAGTVVRSNWSRIPDADSAPAIEVG